MKLEKKILIAVTHFWDPRDHVFHFGDSMEELSSAVEEFSALLAVLMTNALIYPMFKFGCLNFMAQLIFQESMSLPKRNT